MDWEPAIAVLVERGFTAEDSSSVGLRFAGTLKTKFGPTSIRIILDDKGIDPPKIALVRRRPDWLPRFTGHLSENGWLCYVDAKRAYPNRNRPAELVVDALTFATSTLERLVDAGGQVEDEFAILWSAIELSSLPPWQPEKEWIWCAVGDDSQNFYCILQADQTQDIERVAGIRSSAKVATPIRIQMTGQPIAAGPGWPIRSLNDFLRWLAYCDAAAANRLREELHRLAGKSIRTLLLPMRLIFLVEASAANFGLMADIEHSSIWLPVGPQLRRLQPRVMVQHWLRSRTAGEVVIKFRTRNIDAKSMLDRAIGPDMPTLEGKRITLIGAGSVGSYLADALIKSGAGSTGGVLRIVDNDVVSVGNLARANYLFADVGAAKVEALRGRLLGNWPEISIEPVREQAQNVPDIFDADFVIDATGEYSFSCWLSEHRNMLKAPTALTVWIVGAGHAVQTYLQSGDQQACLSCLSTADPKSPWSALSKDSTEEMQTGACGESFMPYSISAPMMAAGLAVSHLLQFLGGTAPFAVKTIRLNPSVTKSTSSDTPPRCAKCPCR